MKVQPSQNPAIQPSSNVQDGTSNTLQVAERTKTEKPFAKDSFESFRFEIGGLPCNKTAGLPRADGSNKDTA